MANFKLKVKRGAGVPANAALDLGELGFNTSYVNGTGLSTGKLYVGTVDLSGKPIGIAMDGHLHSMDDLSGVLGTTFGGTGLDSYVKGDILWANGTNTLGKLAAGSVGQILTLAADDTVTWANPQALVTLTDGTGDYVSDISLSGQALTETKSNFAALTISTGLSGTTYKPNSTATISLAPITAGSTSTGALWYNGTTKVDGQLFGGATNPTGVTRLNYDGYLYATKLYSGANEVYTSANLPSIPSAANNGTLDLTVTAGDTGTGLAISTGTGFSADTASNYTYDLDIGPALSNLPGVMTGAGTGFLKKSSADTYSIDTTTYYHSGNLPTYPESFNLSDDILDGSANKYARYAAAAAGKLSSTNTTAASTSDYLAWSGYLYANKLFSGGTEVLTSYTESDTLATVTGRGATTATAITITNATTSTTTGTGALQVTGGVGIAENLNVGGALKVTSDVTIGGALIVNGTTTTNNSTVVTIDDPIFTLGGDTAPVSDDNKDRGIEFRYFDTTAKKGFFGLDDSTGNFTFIPDGTNTSEIYSGTKGTIDITTLTNSTAGLTLSTGASNSNITIDPDGTGDVLIKSLTSAGFVKTAADGTLSADTSTYVTQDDIDWNVADNYAFKTIAIAGQTSVVADTSTDTLTLVAGGAIDMLTSADQITIQHTDTSTISSSNNSGRTYIQDVLIDTYGHVTGLTTATESVVDTNTFVGLTDTPSAWGITHESKLIAVNVTGTEVEFISELDCGAFAI